MTFLVAEQQGFFSEYGVKFEYITVPHGRKAMEMLVASDVDMAIMADVVFAYMGFQTPVTPVKTIASVEKRHLNNIFISKEHARPEDLIGKTIGFTPRTTSESYLMVFLAKHGITKQQVTLKPLNPQTLPNALMRGEIDALSLWEPYIHNMIYAMRELGMPYTHLKIAGLYTSETVLCATKTLLVKNRNAVLDILKALKAAEIFMHEKPDMAQRALRSKMAIAGEDIQDVMECFVPKLGLVSPAYLDLADMLADLIIETNTAYAGRTKPVYTDFVDNSFLLDMITEKK